MSRQNEHYNTSTVFNDLSSLILNLIRPSPPPPPRTRPIVRRRPPPSLPPLSLFGFASLLLGMSLSLMLCGSVTFFIGFMLIPWVIGLLTAFYVVCSLSLFARTILGLALPPSFSIKDDVPVWKVW